MCSSSLTLTIETIPSFLLCKTRRWLVAACMWADRLRALSQPTAQEIVDSYADIMTEQYTTRMARKLGLKEYRKELAVGLITLMYEDKADFTNSFRAMSSVSADDEPGTVSERLDQVEACSGPHMRSVVLRLCPRAWQDLRVHACHLRRGSASTNAGHSAQATPALLYVSAEVLAKDMCGP